MIVLPSYIFTSMAAISVPVFCSWSIFKIFIGQLPLPIVACKKSFLTTLGRLRSICGYSIIFSVKHTYCTAELSRTIILTNIIPERFYS